MVVPPNPFRSTPRRERPRTMRLEALEERLLLNAPDCYLCETTLPNLRASNSYDYVAVASGKWTDPIWATNGNGIANSTGPQADNRQAKVWIPPGITVTYSTTTASVGLIDVQGTLFITPPRVASGQAQLTVGTLAVADDARLAIGAGTPTAVTDLPANENVNVIYDWYNNPFTLGGADDPERETLGLMVDDTARADIRGAAKTDFVALLGGYTARSATLTVSGPVTGWRAGDAVEIAPTTFVKNQPIRAERRMLIAAPSYNATTGVTTLRLDGGLTYDHTPYGGESAHLANLTRNVTFASADPAVIDHRGHSMFHTADTIIENASFVEMGRTDKSNPLNDYSFGPTADTFDGSGSNRRGRYALHFHRTLENDLDAGLPLSQYHVASVSGCVVDGSPGWGFVNHTSYVNYVGNVAVGCVGAAFVAEAGNELGVFDSNLAMLGTGDPHRGQYQDRRFEDTASTVVGDKQMVHFGDLGFTGDGFWIGAPGLQVTNNIAAGFNGRGFIVWGQPLFEPDMGTHTIFNGTTTKTVDGEMSGYDPSWVTWATAVSAPKRTYAYGPAWHNNGRIVGEALPYNLFDNNTAYASFLGFETRFSNNVNASFVSPEIHPAGAVYAGGGQVGSPTQFSNLNGWNNYEGLNSNYTNAVGYLTVTLVSNLGNRNTTAIVSGVVDDFYVIYDSVAVDGYDHLANLSSATTFTTGIWFTNQPTPGTWVYSLNNVLYYVVPPTSP